MVFARGEGSISTIRKLGRAIIDETGAAPVFDRVLQALYSIVTVS